MQGLLKHRPFRPIRHLVLLDDVCTRLLEHSYSHLFTVPIHIVQFGEPFF